MIVNMKKVDVLLFSKITDDFLSKLQDIGLLHIIEKDQKDEDLILKASVQKKINDLLSLFSKNEDIDQVNYEGELKDLLSEAETINLKLENLENDLFNEQKKFMSFKPWGEYNLETVNKLKENGILIRFYKTSHKTYKKLKLEKRKDIHIQIINEDASFVYFVQVDMDEIKDLDIEEYRFPAGSYSQSLDTINKINKEIEDEKNKLTQLSKYRDFVLKNSVELENIIRYKTCKLSLDTYHDKINALSGFIPITKEKELIKFLDNTDGVYYYLDDPVKDYKPEEVPVLLKNDKFSKLFVPITKLFSLPHYMELDVTPFFAPFFALFFGLCLGDAGYGVILLLASIFLTIKVKPLRNFGYLGIFFGLCTILWGVLSGTLFGIDVFKVDVPIFSDLATFKPIHMFYLALLIGLVQIIFGMVVKIINKITHKEYLSSLSTLGWIVLIFSVVGIYLRSQSAVEGFTLGKMVIDFYKDMSLSTQKYGAILGILLILFFNDLKVGVPLRIGKGLWELYGITGFFGDLLSYIRLFALGISSAILGTVVNALGMSILEIDIPVLSHVLFIIFLIVGHVGNFMLASLGAFVHTLRLTFVEFYKNAGFVGGGKEYTPFSKKNL